MAYYADDLIEQVRSANDIVDVVGSYVSLKKKGNNYWGLCPFHTEKTPSFSVNAGKQLYKCFGCGEGGNVFSFVMKYENLTFPEAVKTLAERAGISLPEQHYSESAQKLRDKKDRLLEVNKAAATYFYKCLKSEHGKKGLEYLKNRGLTDETIIHFGLGYAGINGKLIVDYLREQGYTDEEIRDSGLATNSERNGLSSPFWNRVMYPIFNAKNQVIGFGGRVMGDAQPKYLNSPETDIFDKRRNLYGFNYARTSRTDNFILCEGYMDVISLHQAGFSQAVASLGTAFTEEQALMLKRMGRRILLSYDSDGAGTKAALRALEILRNTGLSGRVINLKPYKDPDEFIKGLGADEFQKRLDEAENGFYFEIRILSNGYDLSDPETRSEFNNEIAKRLLRFETADERENYLVGIADKYMIKPDNLRELLRREAGRLAEKERKQIEYGRTSGNENRQTAGAQDGAGNNLKKIPKSQAELLTKLSEDPSIYRVVSKYVSPADFTDETCRKVAEAVFATASEGKVFNAAAYLGEFEDSEERTLVAGILQTEGLSAELMMETGEGGAPPPEDEGRVLRDLVIAVKTSEMDELGRAEDDVGNAFKRQYELRMEIDNLKKMNSLT